MYYFLKENIGNYANAVSFIGQPSLFDINTMGNRKDYISATSMEDSLIECENGDVFCWSSTKESVFNGGEKTLYNDSKEEIRNWYTSGKSVNELFTRYYYFDEKTGVIQYTEKKGDSIYEVADIYPAYKLMMMITLMLEGHSTYY